MGRVIVMGGMAALLVASIGTSPARADVMCQKPTGAVFVRSTACKGKEKALDLASFGMVGPKGDQGDAGTPGTPGAPGAPGTARARAVVAPYTCPFCIFPPCPPCTGPSLVSAKTASFSGVSRPSAGIMCLSPAAGIDPATAGALVSAETSLGASIFGPFLAHAEVDASGADCAAGEFEVKTWSYDFGTTPPTPTLYDSIGVSVIVP
jgi:hypothetical protein